MYGSSSGWNLAFEENSRVRLPKTRSPPSRAGPRPGMVSFIRNRPARQPFPEHLPRERTIVPGPTACPCCGSPRLAKLGEDIAETLETIPRQWKVIQHVREKFTCRDCEKISQVPAPFHVFARGWAGPACWR